MRTASESGSADLWMGIHVNSFQRTLRAGEPYVVDSSTSGRPSAIPLTVSKSILFLGMKIVSGTNSERSQRVGGWFHSATADAGVIVFQPEGHPRIDGEMQANPSRSVTQNLPSSARQLDFVHLPQVTRRHLRRM